MNRSARTKDDYEFSTAKDPLFNSTRICKVEEPFRQEHRCDCVRTDSNLGMLESRKRIMSARKVLSLSVMNFVALCMLNLVFLNHMQGEYGTSLYSVHASQKVDVRDILDCDNKVIARIVNTLLDPISSKKSQLNK